YWSMALPRAARTEAGLYATMPPAATRAAAPPAVAGGGSAAYNGRCNLRCTLVGFPIDRILPDGDGAHPHPRCADAQPEEHRPRAAAREADRGHRAFGLRQVLARVRHHLRRRPAPLCGVAVGLRA